MEPITKREILIVSIQAISDNVYSKQMSQEQAEVALLELYSRTGFTPEQVEQIMEELSKKVHEMLNGPNSKGAPGIG